MPEASIIEEIYAEKTGWIFDVNAEAFGKAVLVLGGGRTCAEADIDPAVGISDLIQVGEDVHPGDVLFRYHANDPERLAQAKELLDSAITLADSEVRPPDLVHQVMMPEDLSPIQRTP